MTSLTKEKKELVKTQLLIIGAGPGGYISAIYAAKQGLNVTLVERDELGGTCLNVGCIPTKALIQSSESFQELKNSSIYGIEIEGEFRVNMEEVIKRKDEITKRLVTGIEFLIKKNKIELIKGEASFLSNTEVEIRGENHYKVEFENVIIATGSKISPLEIPGMNLPFVMNSTQVLSSTHLPESITIIGGGVIGMEFAFLYRNFGVEVRVIEFMDRVLPMVDEDVSKEIIRAAKKARIKVLTGTKVVKIEEGEEGKAVLTYQSKKGEKQIISERVLFATGREPNLDGLNIEKTEIKQNINRPGIKVDEYLRTNVNNIYAIGDVNHIMQLAHVASFQGIVAVDHILGKDSKFNQNAVPNVIFTSPEIATVGLREEACKEKNIDYTISKVPFLANGKALIMNKNSGFVKLIKDNEKDEIIGGTIIGPDASTLVNTLTLMVDKKFTDKDMMNLILPHPTTGEVLHEGIYEFTVGALHK